jgi:F0F1-type ATP synthase membrane subunit a
MIKYKTRNINDIPKEIVTKYGIIFEFINRYIKNNNNEEKKAKAKESKKPKEELI